MRPWPKELLEHYPLRPATEWSRAVPRLCLERPWWTLTDVVRSKVEEVLHYKVVANRSDGVHIYQKDRRFLGVSGGPHTCLTSEACKLTATVLKGGSWQDARQELIDQVDVLAPLKHPGLRVGQIWAFRHKHPNTFPVESFAIVKVNYSFFREQECWVEFSGPPVQDLYKDQQKKVPDLGFFLSSPEDLSLLLKEEGYLLVDTACPWLAPWSGGVS